MKAKRTGKVVRRSVSTALAAVVVAASAMAAPLSASATAQGSKFGESYGKSFYTSYYAKGTGLTLDYVKITAHGQNGSAPSFPQFSGCGAHVELWNDKTGSNFRRWNGPRHTCSEFASTGYSDVISLYQRVTAGRYCVQIWVDNYNAGFDAAGTACFDVS